MEVGELYTDHCEGLPEERRAGKELAYSYNMTRPSQRNRRAELLEQLLAAWAKIAGWNRQSTRGLWQPHACRQKFLR